MTTKLLPSILISNIFDPVSKDESHIIKLYEDIASLDFYKSLETRIIFDQKIRKQFSELVDKNNWDVTFWITSNLSDNNLSLNNVNEDQRLKAVEYVKQLIELAIQSRGKYIGIPSGKRVHDDKKEFQAFLKSVTELLKQLEPYPQIDLVLEPLDQDAHKRNVIGNLETTQMLMNELDKLNLDKNLILCLDTAHIALNEDSIYESIDTLGKHCDRIHFANAVLDKEHPLYGDNHIPFGDPGFLDLAKVTEITDYVKESVFHIPSVYLTMEIRALEKNDMWSLEKKTRAILNLLLP